MKKVLSIIILCLCFMFFRGDIIAYGQDKEYTIENADFDVYLDENGDATVEEKWIVNFEKGDFTRFYISRLLKTNELENFKDIQFESFKINGTECSKTDDTENRPEGTYSIINNGNKIEYDWYFRASNSMLTLENKYKLTNVVKYNDKGYAFFCYRFVGAEFDKEIENLNINIHSPSSCKFEVRHNGGMDYNIKDNEVEFKESNSSSLVKVNVAMNKDIFFGNITHISQDVLDEIAQEEKQEEIEDIIFGCFFVGAIILIIMIIILKSISRYKNNKLAKNQEYVEGIIKKLKMNNITPFEYSLINNVQKMPMNQFKLIFLELLRKNILEIKKDKIFIKYDMQNNLKSFECNFLRNIKRFEKDEIGYITMEELSYMIMDPNIVAGITLEYNGDFIKKCKKEIKKDIKVLNIFYNKYSYGYSNEMSEILDKYTKHNFIEIENLYYMASTILITNSSEEDYSSNNYYDYDSLYYMDYYSHRYIDNSSTSDSSGCSSCSSCSSCSGCGGGGAD